MRVTTKNIGPNKICPDCDVEKPLSDFFSSNSKRKSPWYSKRCKPCHNKHLREYRKTAKHKKVYKEWANSEKGKKAIEKRMATWRKKNNHKRAAHSAISNAIRDKRIIKKSCVICGNKKSEGHHIDYSDPLHVVWVCKKHHVEIHYI